MTEAARRMGAAIRMVRVGIGVSVLPRWVVRDELAQLFAEKISARRPSAPGGLARL